MHRSVLGRSGSLAIAAGLACTGSAAGQLCTAEWSVGIGQPGTTGVINEMAIFDDGNGPALYVSGAFPSIGGVPAASIAKWNGSTFEALGSGLTFSGSTARVTGMISYDDGTGPALYATGNFNTAGGQPANRIAKWNGSTWSPLAEGLNQAGFKLAVFDEDGAGPNPPVLIVGGAFTAAGPNLPGTVSIARWDGTAWSSVGGGVVGGTVNCFALHDDGNGPSLFVGGRFTTAGTTPATLIARWDGTSWHALGPGLDGGLTRVNAMAPFDDGSGMKLWATGDFTQAGALNVERIAAWDGSMWSAPAGPGIDSTGSALAVFDDGEGSGEKLFVGGAFATAGGIPFGRVASWDGMQWGDLDGGLSHPTITTVSIMVEHDDGQGRGLFIGGGFTMAGQNTANSIAKWLACDACYPDCDTSTGPGVLDIFDFLCFGNRFAANDPYACNCDATTGPNTCDIFDFLCFGNAFSAGCN